MDELRRYSVELIGSFFIAMSIVMSQSSALHKVELALLYGALLYALNSQSKSGATFNMSVSIAKSITGKLGRGDLLVATLGQISGIVLGAGFGFCLHQNEMIIIVYGNRDGTEKIAPSELLLGFLFSFLLSLVGSNASSELTIAYPIAMMASIIAGGMTSKFPAPFTAFNPLAELIFLTDSAFYVVFLTVLSYLMGGILGGYYSLFMLTSERRRGDRLVGLSDIMESAQNSAPFDYQSWIVGVTLEGIGSFYITLVFALAGGVNDDTWIIAVGSIVLTLTFLSIRGYFNPAVTLAFYIQDRNCFQPSMSTLSLFSYIFSQLLFAVAASWIALWIGDGLIRIPSVNPLVKPFPAVFLSEAVFTALIIVCQMYSSDHSAWALHDPINTILYCEQQCLSTGFATMAAISAVTGLSCSALNPAVAIALTISVYFWEMIFGFDQRSYGEINSDFINSWVFFVGPFVASLSVAVVFSVTIRMASHVSRPTRGGQSHSPLLVESKVGNGALDDFAREKTKIVLDTAL